MPFFLHNKKNNVSYLVWYFKLHKRTWFFSKYWK